MAPDEALPRVDLDARNLRGIAHPLRIRMLGILRTDGPATASMLAERLGQNSGAASYHLRQLAEYGFVAEVPELGTRRERWWRAAHANTALTDPDLVEQPDGPAAVYLRSLAQVWTDNLMRAVESAPELSAEWRAAEDFGDYALTLTPGQAEELMAELHGVLRRHAAARSQDPDAAPPADSARVTFQFQLFPEPGERHPA
jgi:DNA-binding transcriptional ArsR family regulator